MLLVVVDDYIIFQSKQIAADVLTNDTMRDMQEINLRLAAENACGNQLRWVLEYGRKKHSYRHFRCFSPWWSKESGGQTISPAPAGFSVSSA